MLRRLLLLIFLLLLLVLAGGAYLYWSAKRAEPRYGGEVVLPGLEQGVTVRYGPHAVPSIEAESLHDLLFAQGYIVASERLWQMDLLRRLASGRLAELFGARVLPADRFFRTIGLRRAAEKSFDALTPEEQAGLRAYAAGVNAYIAQTPGYLPLEYLLTGTRPQPWAPEDSLAIGEYMAWMLSFNLREELVFLRLARRLGTQRALELFPVEEGIPKAPDAADIPQYAGEIPRIASLFSLLAQLGLPAPGPASNAWAINGKRTQDGQALLANDPHLAASLPVIWYELELQSPELHATGVAIPGVPFVAIGHNEDLAWGFTAAMADVQDLFVERLGEDGRSVVRSEGDTEPIQVRLESIVVRGRTQPERLAVYSTSRGVLIDGILGPNTGTPLDLPQVNTEHRLALRTVLEEPDRSLIAFYRLNRAQTVQEACAAMEDLRHAPMNLLVAHRNGDIAWQMSGLLPRRGQGSGKYPLPGWKAEFDWQGYENFRKNPGLTNPPGYALVTANQRPIPRNYPIPVSHSWVAPYRARRIEALLQEHQPLSVEALAAMQMDDLSEEARVFQKALQRVLPELRAQDQEAWRIADEYLVPWDGRFRKDSRGAAFFLFLRPALFRTLYGYALREDVDLLLSIANNQYNALEEVLYSGKSSFWNDQRFESEKGPVRVWARALKMAKEQLDAQIPAGEAPRLDALLSLRFPHAFDRIPLIGDFFSLGPLPAAGDTHSIKAFKTLLNNPQQVRFIPTLRVRFSPTHWEQSRISLPLGQSGHRFSPYRADQLSDWLQGRDHPLQWQGPEPSEAIGIKRLIPNRKPSPTDSF